MATIQELNAISEKYNIVAYSSCTLGIDQKHAVKYRLHYDGLDGNGFGYVVSPSRGETLEQVIEREIKNFELYGDDYMNLLNDTELFPRIKGKNLMNRTATFTIKGVKKVKVEQQKDPKIQLDFSNGQYVWVVPDELHKLNPIVNKFDEDGNPLMSESDLIGLKVVLTGEEGVWFLSKQEIVAGKKKYTVRINKQATIKANKAKPKPAKKLATAEQISEYNSILVQAYGGEADTKKRLQLDYYKVDNESKLSQSEIDNCIKKIKSRIENIGTATPQSAPKQQNIGFGKPNFSK